MTATPTVERPATRAQTTEPPPVRDEAERRADLARMKGRATGLLVAVATLWLVLLVTIDDRGWGGYAIAAAEAGMVGGLADWFAVTALFRHPLGIPIPHTAVVASRKAQFGQTLGQFVQENFLSADIVGRRIAEMDVGRRLGVLLSDPERANVTAAYVSNLAVRFADATKDEEVTNLIDTELRERVEALPIAELLGRALRVLTVDDAHERLLDLALEGVRRFLEDNREVLRARYAEEKPWWVPEVIDDQVFQRIYDGIRNILADSEGPDGQDLRSQIHASIDVLVERLQHDPVMAERLQEVTHDLLEHPVLRDWSSSVWGEIKARLREQAADDGSALQQRVTRIIVLAGERLLTDEQTARWANDIAERAARAVTHQFHDEIQGLVSNTIARWDSAETSDRLELLLGRDLQFIRINGTVVGALAGLTIHGIAHLLG